MQTGAIHGHVVDDNTGEGVGWVQVYLAELNRSVSAHEDGSFHLYNLPPGDYSLQSFRVGYKNGVFPITVIENDTANIELRIHSAALHVDGVLTEDYQHDELSELEQAELEISGRKLRQNLGATIAETIDYEPGLSQRTMGPAPARPVLRGLSGDRLLVLEDGNKTGDLSSTSSDHAVTIEPMTAERIEIIRGPEAFLYGSNTLAGIINVARGYIPTNIPHRLTGAVSFQGENINEGVATGAALSAPVGILGIRADGSYRNTRDLKTPLGTLTNTSIETFNTSLGAGLVRTWGNTGGAASYYRSTYGIPPDSAGGHPGGVEIDLQRIHSELKAEIFPKNKRVRHIELNHNFTMYNHTETEFSRVLGREITGTGYDVSTHSFDARLRFNDAGWLQNAAMGASGEYRDHSTPTGRNETPDATELSAALFAYAETKIDRLGLNASARFDTRSVTPANAGTENYAGVIRERSFGGLSGGLAGHFHLSSSVALGLAFTRSFRAPGIEELYSDGPHLAIYTYEVGNVDLNAETGTGTEFSFHLNLPKVDLKVAAFRNAIGGYIFPENTGERSIRIYSLFEYRFVGLDVLMRGVEGTLEFRPFRNWDFGGTASFVHAELADMNEPIPRIPPLEGKAYLRYHWKELFTDIILRSAAEQTRTGTFEESTSGYTVVDISAQYSLIAGGFLHTFSLTASNIFDTEYRKHLNQIRHVMPEPGRNFRLLYRAFF